MSIEPVHSSDPARNVLRFIETAMSLPMKPPADGEEARFNELALELFAWQFERNPPYRRLCEARGRRPGNVSDPDQIPALPTVAFKEWDVTCLSEDRRETVFHSSGTTAERPGRHFHQADSLALYHASLLPWFRRHFPGCDGRSHFLSLTPSGARAPHSSLAHMLEFVRSRVGSLESWFAGDVNSEGAWTLEPEKVVAWLNRNAVLNQPVILAGTAFNFVHLLDWMINRDERVRVPAGSAVMETGGYKGRSRALPKAELHALLGERLGMPAEAIVCEYGMCELSSQAYDHVAGDAGSERVYRFPPWVRATVVSSEDGGEVAEGRAGLLRILDLANVYSVLAVQTEDLVIRQADGFELIGRAENAGAKGCSLLAV
jgi:hypothetical protein